MRRALSRTIALCVAVATGITLFAFSSPTADAWVSPDLWDPGYIISDEQMYNGNTMTVTEIQAFLNSKVSVCETWRTAGPHDPIVCLKDYRQTTTTRPADAYCPGTYVGASNETAATIIYKVAQACNISPKVLLVTLQKEQGLVTHTWPSPYRYTTAMGYACPDDGTGCASDYYGFQYQIWMAARQFQRYRLLPNNYNYRAGVTNRIQYNPDPGCGFQSVYIRNAATAGLYNYTPYVPNSAALSNMPREGNSCSSYGNRNFWMYYWEWFGSPTATAGNSSMEALYASMGGKNGPLGDAVSKPSCPTNAPCLWTYEGGAISWSPAAGAVATSGQVGAVWLEHRSDLGRPLAPEAVVTDPNGNGLAQSFERGWVHVGPFGAYWSPSSVMTAYSGRGWLRGDLGWPTSDFVCGGPGNYCIQWFDGGAITGPASGTMTVLDENLTDVYRDAGGETGSLGFPVNVVQSVRDPNGDGLAWNLQNGWIHSGPAGTFASPSAVMVEYSKQGWLRGWLGWPASGCSGTPCTQDFAGGSITVGADGKASSTPAVSVPAIRTLYDSLGAASSSLGKAVLPVQRVFDPNGDGYAQKFEGGWIHSSSNGTFASSNLVMSGYSAHGWLRGDLGWPTAPETCSAAGCEQQFSGGQLFAPVNGSAYVVPAITNAEIKAVYDALGGLGSYLGPPAFAVQNVRDPNGNGFAQQFHGGWIHSSSRGTYASPTVVMRTFSSEGWIRGPLGWPDGEAQCGGAADACVQKFANGTLIATPGGGGVVNSSVATAYALSGGPAGPWGFPLAKPQQVFDPNGNGQALQLENGWVHSSLRGTFFSPTEVMVEYSRRGWLRGPLGWPTGPATCDSGGCSQSFQWGTIDTR